MNSNRPAVCAPTDQPHGRNVGYRTDAGGRAGSVWRMSEIRSGSAPPADARPAAALRRPAPAEGDAGEPAAPEQAGWQRLVMRTSMIIALWLGY